MRLLISSLYAFQSKSVYTNYAEKFLLKKGLTKYELHISAIQNTELMGSRMFPQSGMNLAYICIFELVRLKLVQKHMVGKLCVLASYKKAFLFTNVITGHVQTCSQVYGWQVYTWHPTHWRI